MALARPRRAPRLRPALAALALALAAAAPASASPETLKRSIGNILFGPFDMVFAPVVSSRLVYHNLQDIGDSMWVRVAYAVPGVIWNTTTHAGCGVIRTMTGIIELVPGIGLFFFKTDLDPLFSPADKQDALVDVDTPVLDIKFGIQYVD